MLGHGIMVAEHVEREVLHLMEDRKQRASKRLGPGIIFKGMPSLTHFL
jgi:hypothetical protein